MGRAKSGTRRKQWMAQGQADAEASGSNHQEQPQQQEAHHTPLESFLHQGTSGAAQHYQPHQHVGADGQEAQQHQTGQKGHSKGKGKNSGNTGPLAGVGLPHDDTQPWMIYQPVDMNIGRCQ